MRIATADQSRSMNLGQAVAVCLYEISRSPVKAEPRKSTSASAGEMEQLTQMLLEASRQSGYLNPVVASSPRTKCDA